MIRNQLRTTSAAVIGVPSLNARSGPEVEDDGRPAVAEVPRGGERGTGLELGVDRGEALEQLGRDRGAADVALGRRIEVVGGARSGSGRCRSAARAAGADRGAATRTHEPGHGNGQDGHEDDPPDRPDLDGLGAARRQGRGDQSGRSRPPRPRGYEAARPAPAARVDQALDGDGLAKAARCAT